MLTHDEQRSAAGAQRRLAKHYLNLNKDDTDRLHRTVSLVARALNFPIGQINIIDDRALYTIGDYRSGATVIPREDSICQFLVDDATQVLAVEDLRLGPRYRNLPVVRAGAGLSYLGVPLMSREATPVGTLCLVDDRPRHITDADIERVIDFGGIVEDQLDRVRRNAETPASREVSTTLVQALKAGEIVPWYQPVVKLATGRHVGFEALARWQCPDGSVISPDAFIGAAEDSDLVVDVDRAVVRAALLDLGRWRRRVPTLRMGVNLSTRHLELPDSVAFMLDAARDAGVDPSAVSIEITETRVLSDFAGASAAVNSLQSGGFRVVLDDFANGWSGLSWLMGLGANGIKLDRTLAASIGTPMGDAVCRALIGMATELDMTTHIEGLDNTAQLAGAREHGFRLAQGYFWSPPVPARTAEDSL